MEVTDGFDLKAFLDSARDEGAVDSEGAFTMAHDKALTKLARFALPRPYDWVLKILQAANAWECPVLVVQQTRVATSFFFCPPGSTFPDDGDIVQALKSGSFDDGGPVDTLSMALRSLVDQVGLSFVLATFRNGKLGEPIFAGDDVHALSDSDRRAWTNLNKTGLRLTVSHFQGSESFTGRFVPTFSFQERRDLEIAKVLNSGCTASCTKVYLDGRVVSDFSHQCPVKFRFLAVANVMETASGSEEVTWQLFDPTCSRFRHRWEREVGKACKASVVVQTADTCLSVEAYETGPQGYGIVPPAFHLLNWTRFGVEASRRRVPCATSSTSVTCFFRGDHLRSDLSGMNLQVDDEERTRAVNYLSLVAESLPKLHEALTRSFDKKGGEQASVPAIARGDEESELELTAAGFSIFSESLRMKGMEVSDAGARIEDWMARLRLIWGASYHQQAWLGYVRRELELLKFDLKEAILKV